MVPSWDVYKVSSPNYCNESEYGLIYTWKKNNSGIWSKIWPFTPHENAAEMQRCLSTGHAMPCQWLSLASCECKIYNSYAFYDN